MSKESSKSANVATNYKQLKSIFHDFLKSKDLYIFRRLFLFTSTFNEILNIYIIDINLQNVF